MIEHDLNLDTRDCCPVCDGSKVTACKACDGMGYRVTRPDGKYTRIPCTDCEERGYVICPRCQGSGDDTKGAMK